MIPIRRNIERKSKTHPGPIIFDRGSLDFFRQRRFCPRSSFVPEIHRRQEAIRSFPIRERDSRAHFPGSTRVALYLETGSGRSEKTAVELPSWRETPHVSRSRFLFPRERYPWYYLYCSFNRENQAFFGRSVFLRQAVNWLFRRLIVLYITKVRVTDCWKAA